MPIKPQLTSLSSPLSLIPGEILSSVLLYCSSFMHSLLLEMWSSSQWSSWIFISTLPCTSLSVPFLSWRSGIPQLHTKDALLPASWEEHFPKWLSPADVFLPFHRHQWGLSLDSYGLWPLPGHLQPSSLPYYHDLKAMCLADFRLLCLWFCHTPSWDCLDLHIAILWL